MACTGTALSTGTPLALTKFRIWEAFIPSLVSLKFELPINDKEIMNNWKTVNKTNDH